MHVAQAWRLKSQRYGLQGSKCETCRKVLFPPRDVCPYCAARNLAQHEARQETAQPEPVAVAMVSSPQMI